MWWIAGDAILLSPGCASFDEFRNFEHRGQTFSAIAKQSKPQENPQ
jgi:UDP-N-acetylmuramoylalanine-D-glutamate ligase